MHLFMAGKGPMPIQHYWGRLSEEFGGALPTAIFAEQQRLPVGFLEQLIEFRAYASAYHANQVDPKGYGGSEMRQLVQVIEGELAQEAMNTNG